MGLNEGLKVMKNVLLSLVIVLGGLALPAWADEQTELLFVQTAQGVVFQEGSPATLTLKNVSPSVVFFSDRPKRIAGHVSLTGFLAAWAEGSDSFAEDPPNANLSIVDGKTINNTVVELMNPTYDGTDLTYEVVEISGNLPASGGISSLFIDGLFGGGVLRSGGRGAALGAIGGAIAGNAGKGAAIGAAVGIVGGAIRDNQERNQYYQY